MTTVHGCWSVLRVSEATTTDDCMTLSAAYRSFDLKRTVSLLLVGGRECPAGSLTICTGLVP